MNWWALFLWRSIRKAHEGVSCFRSQIQDSGHVKVQHVLKHGDRTGFRTLWWSWSLSGTHFRSFCLWCLWSLCSEAPAQRWSFNPEQGFCLWWKCHSACQGCCQNCRGSSQIRIWHTLFSIMSKACWQKKDVKEGRIWVCRSKRYQCPSDKQIVWLYTAKETPDHDVRFVLFLGISKAFLLLCPDIRYWFVSGLDSV